MRKKRSKEGEQRTPPVVRAGKEQIARIRVGKQFIRPALQHDVPILEQESEKLSDQKGILQHGGTEPTDKYPYPQNKVNPAPNETKSRKSQLTSLAKRGQRAGNQLIEISCPELKKARTNMAFGVRLSF